MTFNGFSEADFDVFSIEGLDPRMLALRHHIQPKLAELGDYFSPILTALTGDEMFYHVAKHARRTVNPPKDTWVAFAANKRGYKKHPHFQIGLWPTHLFIRLAVINECPDKKALAKALNTHGRSIMEHFPKQFVWSADHTKPHTTEEPAPDLIDRLGEIKKAEFLVGLDVDRETTVKSGAEILNVIEKTFGQLAPLYNEMRRRVRPH
ncbi:DUF1054 domain-containing protein [Pullulanibacillus sp. KACC 23026]|uniref:YktB family protein n=1 Tax=Pullulanibacillus sp. KACC 23026 TaxID=3028315 RepID=UPI0023B11640|nr:DUF1054 domain-containing protein [Pullulanibacillus sp. KACC 23026]WEG11718.1 DUF1054 domain-containing protein [Pullulanibacillus sp. KACC 23026]